MELDTQVCPYPSTCRHRGEGGRCLKGSCPFRIQLRRLVAGEIQRLTQLESPTPQQLHALAAWKGRYAQLLREGGNAHGENTASPHRAGD